MTIPTPTTPDIRAARSRERIMAALAELLVEEGVDGFSVQEVADRAGVAHRTVYRHYGSREALLDGFARWIDEKLVEGGGVSVPGSAAGIPGSVREVFAGFDALDRLVEAFVVVSLGTRTTVARRDERTEEFRAVLEGDGLLAHVPGEEAEAVVALIRTLASSNTWYLFRHERGIDGERSGRVVAWAMRILLDELRAGGGPELGEAPGPDEEDA